MIKKGLVTTLFLFSILFVHGNIRFNISENSNEILKEIEYAIDSSGQGETFNFRKQPLPNISATPFTHILRICLSTQKKIQRFGVSVPFPNCEKISLELQDSSGKKIREVPIDKIDSRLTYILIDLNPGTYRLIFRIKSSYPVFFPLRLAGINSLNNAEKRDNLIYCMYFGIMLIMGFYNLFVYFSTRNRSYLHYVIYSISFGLAQFALLGYLSSFFTGEDFVLTKKLSILFSGMAGVFGITFYNSFLETKTTIPRIRKILLVLLVSYSVNILLGLLGLFGESFAMLNLNGAIAGTVCLIGSVYLARQGNRNGLFYSIAWSVFIFTLILFILINVGTLPYNAITKYILPFGSAVEVTLLSLALANKINILEQENASLIKERNIELEQLVKIRTAELETTNQNLKDAQAQLINSEKMASLGQLTAGIAHEINNPINFITSNILPLKRDIKDIEEILSIYESINEENREEKTALLNEKKEDLDYIKEEVVMLLDGMEEGAKRTAEIVKNLKVFSHIDKAKLSPYSINDGLISTLKLVNHRLSKIKVETNLGDIPSINCFPGKLNQVFMNIITNAIDAVSSTHNASISIESYFKDAHVYIEIADNGIGMNSEIIKDIFNPFYTTKDVGSGTGLGLSISLAIIKDHQGEILVNSEPGHGSKFTIIIPEEFTIEE